MHKTPSKIKFNTRYIEKVVELRRKIARAGNIYKTNSYKWKTRGEKLIGLIDNNILAFKCFCFSGDESLSELVFFSELRFEKILKLLVSCDVSNKF